MSPVGTTMLHMRAEAHVLRKKYTDRQGLGLPTMAAGAVLATTIGPRMITMAITVTTVTMVVVAVDGEAEAGAGADLLGVGAGVIGIGTTMTTLAGGATVVVDPESAVAVETVVAVGQEVVVETWIGQDEAGADLLGSVADAAGRLNDRVGAPESEVAAETAEAGDHTVGAGAENAGIETGENVQRRAAAVPKMAAAVVVERTHEIDSKRLN